MSKPEPIYAKFFAMRDLEREKQGKTPNPYELMEKAAKNRFKKQLIKEVKADIQFIIDNNLKPIVHRLMVLEELGAAHAETDALEREMLDMLKLELGKK